VQAHVLAGTGMPNIVPFTVTPQQGTVPRILVPIDGVYILNAIEE